MTALLITGLLATAAASSAVGYCIGYSTALLTDPKGTPPNE